jgi:hypothetical protein
MKLSNSVELDDKNTFMFKFEEDDALTKNMLLYEIQNSFDDDNYMSVIKDKSNDILKSEIIKLNYKLVLQQILYEYKIKKYRPGYRRWNQFCDAFLQPHKWDDD